MRGKALVIGSLTVLAPLVIWGTRTRASRAPLEVVPQVDLARYMGTWYERKEKGRTGSLENAVASIAESPVAFAPCCLVAKKIWHYILNMDADYPKHQNKSHGGIGEAE